MPAPSGLGVQESPGRGSGRPAALRALRAAVLRPSCPAAFRWPGPAPAVQGPGLSTLPVRFPPVCGLAVSRPGNRLRYSFRRPAGARCSATPAELRSRLREQTARADSGCRARRAFPGQPGPGPGSARVLRGRFPFFLPSFRCGGNGTEKMYFPDPAPGAAVRLRSCFFACPGGSGGVSLFFSLPVPEAEGIVPSVHPYLHLFTYLLTYLPACPPLPSLDSFYPLCLPRI